METGGRCEVVGVAEKKRKVEMKLRRVEKWRIGELLLKVPVLDGIHY